MVSLLDLVRLSDIAYEQVPNDYLPGFQNVTALTNPFTGFAAVAQYNGDTKTLVIGFAGTSRNGPAPWATDDIRANIPLSLGFVPSQAETGVSFADSAIRQAKEVQGLDVQKIVYTGHSLGGYIAQHVQIVNQKGSAVVFNSPGYGGIFTCRADRFKWASCCLRRKHETEVWRYFGSRCCYRGIA